MAVNNNHVTGFVIGLGAAAVGFYAYKRNQRQIDGWLRKQGIEISGESDSDYEAMALEDLVMEKERLEDLIAEREMQGQGEVTGDGPGE